MLPSRLTLPRRRPTKRHHLTSNRRRSWQANHRSLSRPRGWRRPKPAPRRPNSNLWTSCSPKTGFRQQTKTNSRASKRVSLSGFWFASHPPWCQFVHCREYAFSTPCGYSRCGPNTRDPKHRSAYLAADKLQSSLRGQLASDGIEHGWTARSTVVSDFRFHRQGAHAAPRCRDSSKCLESCGRCSWALDYKRACGSRRFRPTRAGGCRGEQAHRLAAC